MVSVNNSLLFSQISIFGFYSVVSVQAKLISSEPSSEMLCFCFVLRIFVSSFTSNLCGFLWC